MLAAALDGRGMGELRATAHLGGGGGGWEMVAISAREVVSEKL